MAPSSELMQYPAAIVEQCGASEMMQLAGLLRNRSKVYKTCEQSCPLTNSQAAMDVTAFLFSTPALVALLVLLCVVYLYYR